MQIFKNPNFDFIRYRWHALALSWLIIVAGIATIALKGLPLGVEFSGGTIVIVQFDEVPGIDVVRRAVGRVMPGGGQNIVVQSYGSPELRQIMIRVPQVGEERGSGLSAVAETVVKALTEAQVGKFSVEGTEIVGPVVGRDLTRKGLLAAGLSLAGILVYITLRFQLSFAVGAIVASVHDLLITLAFLAVFRYDMSLNVIAALLTLTGYSMNDTIVIFDRVRENLRGMRRDDITKVVNVAVNQTLNRTVITSGTTLLSVVTLFFLGGEVLRSFAFTMIVGVITGTYSSVFIASSIVTFWRHRKGSARVVAAAPPPTPTRAAAARQRKTGRRPQGA